MAVDHIDNFKDVCVFTNNFRVCFFDTHLIDAYKHLKQEVLEYFRFHKQYNRLYMQHFFHFDHLLFST